MLTVRPIPFELALAVAIVIAACLVAGAVVLHARTLRQLANAQRFDLAAQAVVTDETWRAVVEQLAADVLRQPVRIASFSSLAVGRTCRLRFALKDGRCLEFRSARNWLGAGRTLDPHRDARACGELHAACRYFAQGCEGAGCVPRNVRWRVHLLRAQPARAGASHRTASLQQ